MFTLLFLFVFFFLSAWLNTQIQHLPFVWTHSTLDLNVRKVNQKDYSTDLETLLWYFLNICFMNLVIAAFRYTLSYPDVITVNAGM